ncbi:uncharacterized protein LOC125707186 [Brienomyrus brachyistius]|uniref:uncharacterized protein LOC125707186 n=1 Tax=Brienomyrus brachyistius TaxID=42636 RepID=UPI0020B39A53|nr:uncharacterized protein LOC125707186 [Brienomyrus brachyistius]
MDVPAEFISDDEPQTVSSSYLKNKHRQAVPIRPAGVSQGEIGSPKELWEKSSYKVAESWRSRSVSSPQKAAPKPGIAHMADSAKTAKMSHRPKALPKPRSAKPALRSGMSVFKKHTSTQQAPISRQDQPHVHPCWETWPPGSKVCQNVGMGPWKRQVLCGPASTLRLEPVNRKASRTPTNTWCMKSAAYLLEEAKQIAGIKSMGEEMAPLEDEPDQAPTGDAGKMVDRSIWGAMDVEVLQVVSGDTMESEPPGREDTSSQQVALWAVGLQQQQPAPEHVAVSGATKIVDTGTLGKLTICEEDDVITTSLPPHKVTYGDFLVVKGGAIATTQRQERLLKQRRSLQGLSYLATWKPKTKTEEHKSIHHLCTAPVFDVLPLRLQLASRACHTLCQLPVEPQVTRERAALSQIPDQPQHR